MSLPEVLASGITKTFGAMRALDDVSLVLKPGTFHAVVGENGAGKSTLAKCVLGFYKADSGLVRVGQTNITTPVEARNAGLGMVFQHFTLAPSLTVTENLLLARQDLPVLLNIDRERRTAQEFLKDAPFAIDLNARVQHLAAGQKQKVEILKQLYLRTRVLILDEPTSVLTPTEADEVMGFLRRMVDAGSLSVLLITHKFREVTGFADEVTVLRRGRWVATRPVKGVTSHEIASLMMGDAPAPQEMEKAATSKDRPALRIDRLIVNNDAGLVAVREISLTVRAGEILGIAGISGNGQRELVQAIGGQRPVESGTITAFGSPFQPTRERIRNAALFTLPEEPLQNATVPSMSVGENLILRRFDRPPFAKWGFLLDIDAIRRNAEAAIVRFSIRPSSALIAAKNLSGGNVQRTVLARELGGGEARILVVANPCFGLDFAATAFVHNQLTDLRNSGGAVLLISEDLEELVKLADRIAVMSEGQITHETTPAQLDVAEVGRLMAGHH